MELFGPFLSCALARQKGLPRYFTGRPCSNGHISLRITSTETCVDCRSEQRRVYKRDKKHSAVLRAERRRRFERLWQTNPEFVLWQRVVTATGAQMRRVAAGTKSQRRGRYTQATAQQLRDYLTPQFQPGFTWRNYGTVWQIDHIRPRGSFDLSDPAQAALCAMWFNLQPLTQEQNSSKGDRWTPEDEQRWSCWARRHGYSGELFLVHASVLEAA